MKSPENKTLSFIFWSVPGTRAEHVWTVRVTIPPGSTEDTLLMISARGDSSVPIAKGSFEIMGTRVRIVNGNGVLPLREFMKGIHEPGVWMIRPGHPPVPGALTFG